MSTWQRWKRLSLANKVAVSTSIIALVFTFGGLFITAFYSNEQKKLDSSVATFQSQAQTTALYQSEQQVFIQQTQIVLNDQMRIIAIQQAFPLMVVVSSKPIIQIDQIRYEENAYITGMGSVEFVIANNGGGKASFYDVSWNTVNNLNRGEKFLIREIQIENSTAQLPFAIEGQTPIKIQIIFEASISAQKDEIKNNQELGQIWIKGLQESHTFIVLQFSNADSLSIPMTNTRLFIPTSTPSPVATGGGGFSMLYPIVYSTALIILGIFLILGVVGFAISKVKKH